MRNSRFPDTSYSFPRRRRTNGMFYAIVIIFGVIFGAVSCAGAYYHKRQVTFTVTDRERVCNGNGSGNSSCKYLIWTNKGVYKDTDSLLRGKFRSSDLYGMLQPGKTFHCTVQGFRAGILSEYPNILDCKPA